MSDWDDYAYVYDCVGFNGGHLKNASERLKDDEDIVSRAFKENTASLEFASDRLKDDKEFVKKLITIKGDIEKILEFVSERLKKELKDDENALMSALKTNWYPGKTVLKYASDRLKDDKEFVLDQVKRNGKVFELVSDRLKDDEDVVNEAVHSENFVLKYASDRLRNDPEFVKGFMYYGPILEYAGDRLRGDLFWCLEFAKKDKKCIPYFLGEASTVFKVYNNDMDAIEQVCQEKLQQQANNNLLDKLKQSQQPEQHLFKRKLNV